MREGRGPGSRRIDIVSGLLAGVVSALLMTVFMLGLRALFGVATPSELIGDRLASALSVDTFLSLLNRAGGYNQLKQIGFVSVLVGQLIVGALGGIVYALLTHNVKSELPTQPRSSVTTKGGAAVHPFVHRWTMGCFGDFALARVGHALSWLAAGPGYSREHPHSAFRLCALW